MSGNPVPKNTYRPFAVPWMDSCYQQTLLPNAPWHKLEEALATNLARHVKKQFAHPGRREMLLHLLGESFLDSYLPSEMPNPQLLEPPQMGEEERHRLQSEAQSWLQSQAYKVVHELGYQSMLTPPDSRKKPAKDMSDFLQHTFTIFSNGLDRELFFLEQQLMKKKKEEIKLEMHQQKKFEMCYIPVPSVIKLSSCSSLVSEKPSTSHIKANLHKLSGDPPPLWGPQSDEMGKAVVLVLQRDPRKFDHVAGRLHGRQLPGTLRSYIWADILFRQERRKMKEVNVERTVRERFARMVQKGLAELGIKRATQSPITGLIENAVIEIYSRTVGMIPFITDTHLRESARVLNVLYVYDRSYEPYLIHWLLPLQLALRDNTDTKGESVYELAMYLDLLNNSFPSWPQVFVIAEKVMETLRTDDPELHDHLREIAFLNVQFNPKEFLVQLIHQEKAKAEALMSATPRTEQSDPMSSRLLADPLIFLRKWIGEGFVSVLDSPAIMYVWDQCFMQAWKLSVLEHFCLAILELLRYKFMVARDYPQMKEVFFSEPCKLYTVDLQMAWIHLENNKPLMEIPYMNRQRPTTPVGRSVVSSASVAPVQPCGIKYIRLKLIFPAESFQKEPLLSESQVSDLKLNVTLNFGSILLTSESSVHTPIEVKDEVDSYGGRTLYVKFPVDKFEFDSFDTTQYDVEKELGASPFAVITVEYTPPNIQDAEEFPLVLGWSQLPLHQQISASQWTLPTGNFTYTLHPGRYQENTASPVAGTSSQYEQGLLGYQSELSAVIYDPSSEPYDEPSDVIPAQLPPQDTREPSPKLPESPLKPASVVPTPKDEPEERTPSEAPARRPSPKDIISPPDGPSPVDPAPWVPHRTKVVSWHPPPSTPSEAFDIYLDGVRFIPDNASIVKVTGRVLNAGDIASPPDVLAFPQFSSQARSPTFRYKLTVNENYEEASADMIILLRLYTVDIVSEKLVVVGSCLVGVFDTDDEGKPQLRVGGHQLRLHNGMPDRKKGAVLKSLDMDKIPAVPGCSILVRLMPHSRNFVPVPKYGKGYYKSHPSKPTVSEDRIFTSYSDHLAYPNDVRQMMKRVQAIESVPPMVDEEAIEKWMVERLDVKKRLPASVPAGNINIIQCVRYRIKTGLSVHVKQAFGIEENRYIQCFIRVAPGRMALSMEPTEAGYGGAEQWTTLKHDYNSLLRAPVWLDPPQEIHPFYDERSCMVIQMVGLGVAYHPTREHKQPGKITSLEGGKLRQLGENSLLGWTVVPLFEGNSVLMGEHQVPLFSGKPSAEILDDLSKQPMERVIQIHQLNRPTERLFPGHLSVTVWDSHFQIDENPAMPTYTNLLRAAGNLDLYVRVQFGGTGKTITSLVNENFGSYDRARGTTGEVFQIEKVFFEQLMEKTYYELVENALMEAGYGPLKTIQPEQEADVQPIQPREYPEIPDAFD